MRYSRIRIDHQRRYYLNQSGSLRIFSLRVISPGLFPLATPLVYLRIIRRPRNIIQRVFLILVILTILRYRNHNVSHSFTFRIDLKIHAIFLVVF